MKPDYWRQTDLLKMDTANRRKHIVIGAGSVGSYLVYGLAKLGIKNITVYDADKAEAHNIPNQFFIEGIPEGMYKVHALQQTISKLMDVSRPEINAVAKMFDDSLFANMTDYERTNHIRNVIMEHKPSIVFVTVDSMSARSSIYKILKPHINNAEIRLIDVRVGVPFINVYDVKGSDETNYYETTLCPDEDVPDLPCTATSVVDMSFHAAGLGLTAYRRHYGKLSNRETEKHHLHSFFDYSIMQGWVMQKKGSLEGNANNLMDDGLADEDVGSALANTHREIITAVGPEEEHQDRNGGDI
jgi:hypothetical protein